MDANNRIEGNGIGFRDGRLTTGNDSTAAHAGTGGLATLPLPVIIATIKRQKWMITGLAAAGLLAGLLITLLTDPVYEATAQIEVNPENLRAVEVQGQPVQSSGIDETYMETQEELLRTRALRERVARKLKLDLDPAIANSEAAPKARIDSAVTWLDNQVAVTNLLNTRLFAINVESSDRQRAVDVANTYVEEFIELNIERQLDTSAYARDYLAQQIAETKANLEESERALVEYARNREIVTLGSPENRDGGSESLATKSLADINAALIDARSRRIAAQQRLRFAASGTRQQNAGEAALNNQLAQLRAEYRQKRDLFKPDYPEMVALQEQISSLEASLANLGAQDRGESQRVLQSEYNAALGEERQLESQLARFKALALNERDESIQYNILKRDVDTNAAQYDALLERFKQIGTAGTQVQNLISVVDPATLPRSPVRPVLSVNLVLGLMAGLVAGVIAAILSSLLSTRVRTQRDVDQLLEQQFIGAVPFGDEFENIALELNDPKTPIYEAFVSIANRLRFATGEGFPNVLSLSSTMPNEGKSSTAYGLAHILARQGRRVLLIDADLRMPTFLDFERGDAMPAVREQAKINEGRGLTDILVGDVMPSQAMISVNDKLDLIPSGETPPNPAELLSSERFASMLSDQAGSYDHVIVDAPPVLGLADAPIVASLVDGTLFVVQSSRATSQQIRGAIQRLHENSGTVLGVILTQTSAEEAEDEYGYNYHYSYGSSQEAEPRGLGRVLKNLKR